MLGASVATTLTAAMMHNPMIIGLYAPLRWTADRKSTRLATPFIDK
ncbi:hypothetical protein [Coxiella endosymbiont of Ornithodoros amblus]|nr:hypothetical protein [Coxiella endosymbiont of Ornithodoros amblus]